MLRRLHAFAAALCAGVAVGSPTSHGVDPILVGLAVLNALFALLPSDRMTGDDQ